MGTYRVAVVDDEIANLESLERILKSDGAEVRTFLDPHDALVAINDQNFDVVLSDLRMGNLNGLELLESLKVKDSFAEVILMTAYGTVEVAVSAMKKGAYDFITKPLQKMDVLKAVHRALEKRRLTSENQQLREELRSFDAEKTPLLGRSIAMRAVLDVAEQAAQSRANVLIEGESGTGKGLLAKFLHDRSTFSTGILVKINCAAIPENLLEAELFGYERGAYTGANKTKPGRVELAHQGTLFLDEIGTAPMAFQAKLLRFLQEGEFERLGSNETRTVNTRVISASNQSLVKLIAAGLFREDLFYRLNVVHIVIPPLRDRFEDIRVLITKFLSEAAIKNGRAIPTIESEALEKLDAYGWPGNVRELQNLIESAVVLDRTGIIRVQDLPRELGGEKRAKMLAVPIGMPLREVERLVLDETLQRTRGDKRLAAKILGIHPRTLYRRLGEYSEKEE